MEPRTRARTARRGSLSQLGMLFSGRSVPASDANKQRRRSSLSSTPSTKRIEVPKNQMKQMRRGSLGQMLGSAQRIFKEDSATCVASDCSYSVASHEQEAEMLLKEVNNKIKLQTTRKAELEASIESCMKLAKARLASGNPMGAILSMRRVHKHTTMVAYIAGARYQLNQIRDSLENHEGVVDIGDSRRVLREITSKLLKAESPTPSDSFLLHQLESQLGEVGF